MLELLKMTWEKLSEKYASDTALTTQLWDELIASYTEKHRTYHNLTHISSLLTLADEYKDYLSDMDAVQWAIWYHDVVYSPTNSDNEEKSAQLARDRLAQLTVSSETINKVCAWILATKHYTLPQEVENNDGFWFLDLDLSILGAAPDVYHSYAKAIREEYSIYPDVLYKSGRKKVLKHFLQKKRIYQTELAFQRWERQARINIEREMNAL